MSAIEATDLEKRFGPVRALADVSVSIPRGSLTLIAGANGAGKSTLLRILGGLTRPTRGRVRVLGSDLFSSAGAATRGRVGYLGPEASLYGELTVAENLAFCARLHGVPAERIGTMIDDLELAPVARRRVRTLSSGWRRRAGLVRALLADPQVILLDEPWNGLDRKASALLARVLTRSRDEGRAVLVAAHDVQAYADLFDRSLVLDQGRVVRPEAPVGATASPT